MVSHEVHGILQARAFGGSSRYDGSDLGKQPGPVPSDTQVAIASVRPCTG
jgi:hypothetical protein